MEQNHALTLLMYLTEQVGMSGENLGLHTFSGASAKEWQQSAVVQRQPLTWFKVRSFFWCNLKWNNILKRVIFDFCMYVFQTTFNAPAGNDPLALDMSSMGKGQIWINGESIGRHWPANKASGRCGQCNYAGMYTETKCLGECGQPSQRWYHVPRSWLRPTGNLLVVFEEIGGNPRGISLVKRTNM